MLRVGKLTLTKIYSYEQMSKWLEKFQTQVTEATLLCEPYMY